MGQDRLQGRRAHWDCATLRDEVNGSGVQNTFRDRAIPGMGKNMGIQWENIGRTGNHGDLIGDILNAIYPVVISQFAMTGTQFDRWAIELNGPWLPQLC